MGKSKKQQKLSNLECASFCSQMTMVLHAGFPAVEGVSLLLEDAKDVQEKAILQVMYDEMINTGLLYPALEKTSVFPDYLLQMVKIGEETGTLDDVMNGLTHHYEREDEIEKMCIRDSSNVVSTTHSSAGTKAAIADHIPAGAKVTVTEVYSGAGYRLVSEPQQTAEISADEIVKMCIRDRYTAECNDKVAVGVTQRWNHSNLRLYNERFCSVSVPYIVERRGN